MRDSNAAGSFRIRLRRIIDDLSIRLWLVDFGERYSMILATPRQSAVGVRDETVRASAVVSET
ncbi:hypothetical protein [Rhodococcus sp. SMB37]|uniref:hypothetical protein n=1 Tax=Rhodococcus sp. SMB37 TaxID=2512213 RepID=UPI0018EEAC4E|nr:hypothetical protein [Rhodococcus sp. SMB37]